MSAPGTGVEKLIETPSGTVGVWVGRATIDLATVKASLAPRAGDASRFQAQVARGLLLGEKEFAIADRLGISVHTVHNHRRRLYAKLEAHDYATAIRKLLDAALRAAERRAAAPNTLTEKKGGPCTQEEDEGTSGSA